MPASMRRKAALHSKRFGETTNAHPPCVQCAEKLCRICEKLERSR